MKRLTARHPFLSAFLATVAVFGLVLVAVVETAANLLSLNWS
jgi:hypothetical protein